MARDERGMVLIFWALSFIGLLMFLVIVADAGLVFLERRSLQNTADAAALAGARELYINGPIAGEAEAVLFASESDGDLTSNIATASGITMRVTSTVGDNAASLLADPSLGFGNPAVSATATARIGAAVLPGPGVFCIGTFVQTQIDALDLIDLQLAGFGLSYVWQLPYGDELALGTLLGGNYLTTLCFGAGDGSNAGYIDIGNQGGAAQAVRTCFELGSAEGLQPIEPTQTGIVAGPASQGLQNRLEAARARGCYYWDDVRASLLAADPDGDGVLENEWTCSPNLDQASSIVLVPVVDEDFTAGQGATEINVHFNPAASQYQLAYFWIDGEETFKNTNTKNWQFDGDGGLGQIELDGIFLNRFLTELTSNQRGSGGTVACVLGVSSTCFLELVE